MSFMKEVKNEIFGSRKSYLKEWFKKHKLAYTEGFFVVTCRARINSDKKTRYLILIENQNNLDISNINENIPIYRIKFNEQYAYLTNLRNEKDIEKLNFEELKRWIVNKTRCNYVQPMDHLIPTLKAWASSLEKIWEKAFLWLT